MSLNNYLALSCILFTIGMSGLIFRKNIITLLMCMELILTAANLAMVAFSRFHLTSEGIPNYSAQSMVFFVITVAAAEVAIGLSIVTNMYKSKQTVNINNLNQIKDI